MSLIITLNTKLYTLPEDMIGDNGYGYNITELNGAGTNVARWYGIMEDLLADATRAKTTTSTTSITIALAQHIFILGADVSFRAGDNVLVVDRANPTLNKMNMEIDSYVSATKTLTGTAFTIEGSGTISDWDVSFTGPQGATGATGPTFDISASSAITTLADTDEFSVSDGAGEANNKKITHANVKQQLFNQMEADFTLASEIFS